MCSRIEQFVASSNKEKFKDGCSKKEQSNTTCTKINGDKNCQAERSDMWLKKPIKDMEPNGPASTSTA